MLTSDEARARVARGAAHLDRTRPGWFTEIDVGRLSLQFPCACIVGQLVGLSFLDFHDDVGVVFPEKPPEAAGFSQGAWFGVDHNGLGDLPGLDKRGAYEMLQDAWIEAIAARLVVGPEDARSTELVGVGDDDD